MAKEMVRPFWQEFAYKILETLGIDATKHGVKDVSINVFGARQVPEITVTFELYEQHTIIPIVEIFQAAEWKNTKDRLKVVRGENG